MRVEPCTSLFMNVNRAEFCMSMNRLIVEHCFMFRNDPLNKRIELEPSLTEPSLSEFTSSFVQLLP